MADEEIRKGTNVWRVADKVLGNQKYTDFPLAVEGKPMGSDEEKAEIMNSFFISKVKNLMERVDDSKAEDPLGRLRQKLARKGLTFDFRIVTVKEVEQILRRMKSSHSSGTDGISSAIIRPALKVIAPALTIVINRSLVEGIFPAAYKVAKVLPVFKNKGSKDDPSNYRPISNLPIFGKCQEIVVDLQLREHCERYGLFGAHQHGFRKHRSTSTALLTTITRLRTERKTKFRGILFYDLSAAYDVLPPDIFLEKAKLIGVRDKSLAWLSSYLSDRSQIVQVNQALSRPLKLTAGTPQGGSCSCLIFALYVGDAELWVDAGHVTAFADDTMILVEADSMDELRWKLETEGGKVLRFFASNRLIANPSKTGLLVFRPKVTANALTVEVVLGGEKIVESSEQKVLGIIIDKDLKWAKQTDKIAGECNYRLSTLRRLRYYLNTQQVRTIAEGLIMSRLRYCLPVWAAEYLRLKSSDPQSQIVHGVQVLQNEALRIITKSKRRDHVRISDMLEATHMLSVNQLTAFGTLMEIWKSRTFNIPHLSSLLEQKPSGDRILRSDSSNVLQASEVEPFSICAEKLWNMSSECFKTTKLISVAKSEARKTALQVPI